MKDCTLPALIGTAESRRRRLAATICVLLLTAVLAGTRLSKEATRESGRSGQDTVAVLTHPSESNFHYFRSGQWLADMRSLVAACKYLLQPDWA
jgi:hypothetical protein